MDKNIKLILVVLLLLCLAKMPYGYYELVRMISLVGFVILGYQLYHEKRIIEAIIYFGLALLFQPLFKIALGRQIWNIVDVIIALGLLISIFIFPKNNRSNNKIQSK